MSKSHDWRSYFEKELLGAWDFPDGKDVTVTMREVKGGEVGHGKNKTKKPILHFNGFDKGLAINATNGKLIAAMYGNDTRKWVGQRITLYPTTTTFGGETVECIRVRNRVPPAARPAAPRNEAPALPPHREPGDDSDEQQENAQ